MNLRPGCCLFPASQQTPPAGRGRALIAARWPLNRGCRVYLRAKFEKKLKMLCAFLARENLRYSTPMADFGHSPLALTIDVIVLCLYFFWHRWPGFVCREEKSNLNRLCARGTLDHLVGGYCVDYCR